MFALGAICVGAFLGGVCGGSLRRLATVTLRGEGFILAVFVLQALVRGRGVPMVVGASAGTLLWVLLSLTLVALLITSRASRGAGLMSIGIALNVLVVLANGFMPVSSSSGLAVGHSLTDIASRSYGIYATSGPNTLLGLLGDTLPMPLLDGAIILSPGDVLLGVGVVCLIAHSMLHSCHEAA